MAFDQSADRELLSLAELLAGFAAAAPDILLLTATGVSCDSRQVGRGELFLALPGERHHGLDFYTEVRAAGAVAVGYDPSDRYHTDCITAAADCPLIEVPGLGAADHAVVAALADRFYRQPSRRLSLIGATGTDGKSSCTHFIAESLSAGESAACGLLGTLGYGLYGDPFIASAAGGGLLTTPDPVTLRRWLAAVAARGAAAAAMEVSSHALAQGRTAGLSFEVAVLTNLSRDHLDYHGSMEAYAAAKRRLFDEHRPRYAVLNLDDPFGRSLCAKLRQTGTNIIGYRLTAGEFAAEVTPTLSAEQVLPDRHGLTLRLRSPWGDGELRSGLLGRFNASNLLASLGTLLALGVPFDTALSRLSAVHTAPGRMEQVIAGCGGRPLVVVDYAHTPHALEQALRALREHLPPGGRLWCVFGCGGDRDSGKRPLMGAAAARWADLPLVTSDNPRSEPPELIAAQVVAGMNDSDRRRTYGPPRIELDRGRAICTALAQAGADDIVLIAGKGHEDYQQLADGRVAFSDRDVARRWLERAA